jgi:hypothetical protein
MTQCGHTSQVCEGISIGDATKIDSCALWGRVHLNITVLLFKLGLCPNNTECCCKQDYDQRVLAPPPPRPRVRKDKYVLPLCH